MSTANQDTEHIAVLKKHVKLYLHTVNREKTPKTWTMFKKIIIIM